MQLAKAFRAEVTGACSIAKLDLVRSPGADHVIDYTQDHSAESAHRYDLILGLPLVSVASVAPDQSMYPPSHLSYSSIHERREQHGRHRGRPWTSQRATCSSTDSSRYGCRQCFSRDF